MTKSLERLCMSKAPGHSTCLKLMLMTITIQGLTLATTNAAAKQTLMFGSS